MGTGALLIFPSAYVDKKLFYLLSNKLPRWREGRESVAHDSGSNASKRGVARWCPDSGCGGHTIVCGAGTLIKKSQRAWNGAYPLISRLEIAKHASWLSDWERRCGHLTLGAGTIPIQATIEHTLVSVLAWKHTPVKFIDPSRRTKYHIVTQYDVNYQTDTYDKKEERTGYNNILRSSCRIAPNSSTNTQCNLLARGLNNWKWDWTCRWVETREQNAYQNLILCISWMRSWGERTSWRAWRSSFHPTQTGSDADASWDAVSTTQISGRSTVLVLVSVAEGRHARQSGKLISRVQIKIIILNWEM